MGSGPVPSLVLALAGFVTSVIGAVGYPGLFALATAEGLLPIPSELIVPFAGALAAAGRFDLVAVILVATAGAALGATIAYYVGLRVGRPLVERYGRYIGLGESELRWAETWFRKYGDAGNLIGHALPGVRSFISFPAGIARMDVRRYVAFTAIGSGAWNVFLALVGFYLLGGWLAFAEASEGIDLLLLVAAVALALGYVYWRKRVLRARGEKAKRP